MPLGLITDTDVRLRIPGDLFRAVNPRTFSYPPVTHEIHEAEFGTVSVVTAKVEGIPETFDLLFSMDVDAGDVEETVIAFNDDPFTAWSRLLSEFFTEQRAANAEKRAILKQDDMFLFDLEASFLR